MPNDLESSLADGGLSPVLAKIIANAIDNAGTPKYSRGRSYGDSTPVQQLRMVDADTRRYRLSNLDHKPSRRREQPHPYANSQPATAQGTLTTPSVVAGDYVAADTTTEQDVRQAKVGLKIADKGGPHARLDPTSGAIQGVPFSVEVAQEQFVDARFEERPEGTVLRIALRNIKEFTLPDGTKFKGWAS